MTRFTVAHTVAARDGLARLWLSARDRDAVTAASDRIDRELAVDPDRKGRPFLGDRVFVAGPLYAVFSVSPGDRLVTVWEVGLADPPETAPGAAP